MSAAEMVGLVVALGLVVYLIVSLIFPDWF